MKEIILSCKNKSELCDKLGMCNNGKNMKIIDNLLEKYEMIDYFNNKINYNKKPKLCKNCNKKIEYENRDNIFCNSSCAAQFNNKNRKRSELSKNKTSLSLIKYYQKHNSDNIIEYIGKICPICKKTFFVKNVYKGRKRKYCSKECSLVGMRINVSKSQKERVKNGTHKGWQSRNISSYPEKFFKQVFKNNNLEDKYLFNHPFNGYFLDFFFYDKNIDLEIDGKQHLYQDRKESDKERDKIIKQNNIIVYRIKWKSINTEEGKKYIKNEIDNFLNFYNKN